jgi:hypothetical protein
MKKRSGAAKGKGWSWWAKDGQDSEKEKVTLLSLFRNVV